MVTIREAVAELVENWPDVTSEQRDKLRALLGTAQPEQSADTAA